MGEENTSGDIIEDINPKQINMEASAIVEQEAADPKLGNLDDEVEDDQQDISTNHEVHIAESEPVIVEGTEEAKNVVDEPQKGESASNMDKTEIKEDASDVIDKVIASDKLDSDVKEANNMNNTDKEAQMGEDNIIELNEGNIDAPNQDEINKDTTKIGEVKVAVKMNNETKKEAVFEENGNEDVDKLVNTKPTEKVESYSDDEIDLDDGVSSDSNDSSEDSSSSSESGSDSDSNSDSDDEDKKVSNDDIDDLADDEDEPLNGPIVSKNEVADELAPKLPENYKIPDNAPLELIGEITGLVEKSVIIKANISGEFRVLNDSSVFCFEDRTILGPLFETFGRLQSPMYRVKFDDENEFNKLKDKNGAKVYYVVPDSQFIYTDTIKNLKGTDASNCHDEELPEEEQEFSDDERELAAKQSKKRKKKTKNTKDSSVLNDSQTPKQTNNRKRHHGNNNSSENQNSNQNSKYQPYGYSLNNQAQQFNIPPNNSVQHQHNNPLIHSLPNLQVQQILQVQQQQQQQQGYVPHVQPPQQNTYFPSPQQTYNLPQLQNQFQSHSLVYGTPYNQQQQHNMLGQNQQPIYNQNSQLPNPYFPQGTTGSYVPNVPQNNYAQWNQGAQQNQLQQLQQLVVNHLNGQTQQQSLPSNNLQYPGGNNQFPPQN